MAGKPRSRSGRKRQAASPDWLAFQKRLIHPDQIAYEEIRPVVALQQDLKARAAEIGVSPRTLSRRVDQFVQHSIPGLVASSPRRPNDRRRLPQPIRDSILQLKAEHPPFTPREIAALIEVRSARRVGHHTV